MRSMVLPLLYLHPSWLPTSQLAIFNVVVGGLVARKVDIQVVNHFHGPLVLLDLGPVDMSLLKTEGTSRTLLRPGQDGHLE